ncbi:hypothetical protein [Streptomyces sp. NPDC059894]|uniref:hypothetical protein n=1 Tax=unclassified Streptomyces TaxID=2593676 RepID=UPI00364D3293
MGRDPAQLDTDLTTAEDDIRAIKKELGSIPSGNRKTVLDRLTELEKLTPVVTQLGADVKTHGADITTLKEKMKTYRWMLLGAVAGLQFFKLDIQGFKMDITLFKEWKKKDVAEGFKNAAKHTKALFSAQARATLAGEKQRKADEKRLKDDFEAALKGIPQRVDTLEEAVTPSALRKKLDPFYYQKSHAEDLRKGISRAQDTADKANRDIDSLRTKLRQSGSAGAPKPPQMKSSARQEVTRLRASVTALSQALASI